MASVTLVRLPNVRRIAPALALALAACAGAPESGTACEPTVARMSPPQEAVDFFAGGSSQPEGAREYLRTANWYGNDAMWVVLPPNGEIVGRLDDKIPPYRMKPGRVEYEARRLDGKGTVRRQAIGPSGYGDIGFQAGGPSFPAAGCWEVTYVLDGGDPLRYVLKVSGRRSP